MSAVPSVGANSASPTYGGTCSVVPNMSSAQHPRYPVCYAQSIVPGISAPVQMDTNGGLPRGPP